MKKGRDINLLTSYTGQLLINRSKILTVLMYVIPNHL